MALLDTLRQRAALRGGTARVDCGELGLLTVEALSPADCTRLAGDSRALLYAACRELQHTGEALRSEGVLFRPDEVTAYLTDAEADAAARTVWAISGLSEIRPESVQTEDGIFSEIRLASVQTRTDSGAGGQTGEIRPLSVQSAGGGETEDGQVSCELDPLEGDFPPLGASDRKSQIIGELSAQTPQIVVPKSGEVARSGFWAGRGESGLHEIESEFGSGAGRYLHETASENGSLRRGLLHETESEFGAESLFRLHETGSESGALLHEIKSELRAALHEIKSEWEEDLHEIRSELAEEAARRLAEGLRQAGQVR